MYTNARPAQQMFLISDETASSKNISHTLTKEGYLWLKRSIFDRFKNWIGRRLTIYGESKAGDNPLARTIKK